MRITEAIEINAPLPVVWQVFSDMAEWKTWNTVCENCCILEGKEMAPGTCFSFTLRPYYIPLKITPQIVQCDFQKQVIWAGSRLGVHAKHRFVFCQQNSKVLLVSTETFHGLVFCISRLIGVPKKLHYLTRQLLKAVKKQSESCAESE